MYTQTSSYDVISKIAGFDWDAHNRAKCQKHGVSLAGIESVFSGTLMIRPDWVHADREERFHGIGKTAAGRHLFLVFTFRTLRGGRMIRPISARYMHLKEVRHYEDETP